MKSVLVAQLCLTLCSSVHGILQARVLEWVAIAFFEGGRQPCTLIFPSLYLTLVFRTFSIQSLSLIQGYSLQMEGAISH